jgi:hypothetical protein
MLNDVLRKLPYAVHTNRELGFMLSGRKPLACFVDGKDCFPDVVVRYLRLFDRYVADGRLIRSDHFSDVAWGKQHHILFAIPSEEWRIDTMLELLLSSGHWTAQHERRQGELLGYEDWMNDYWLDQVFGH